MGRSLGSLGKVREALDVDFDYFGTMVRVNPDLSDMVYLEVLANVAKFDDDTPTDKIDGAIQDLRASVVHPDDLDAFRKAFKANRQNLEDLVSLAQQILEAVTEVPTEQPSDSSDGLTTTPSSSVAVSSSPVVTRLEQQGRPDLALVVVQAQEYAAASG